MHSKQSIKLNLGSDLMSALTKAEISDRLITKHGFKRTEAKAFVETFFEEICQSLEGGYHVKLSGFGNFCLRDKSERPGRNPKTGEEIPVTARRVVTFRPGVKLRERVNEASRNFDSPEDSEN